MTPLLTSCLAFDTATEHLSIALQVHGRVWSHEGPGGALASTTLIPAIFDLLAQAGIGLRDLDAIAFGRGPGAFTGLRTACSVAQGLAFGADLPVLPIDTLLAVAEDARQSRGAPAHDDVWVAMDARMDQVYTAAYEWRSDWQCVQAPSVNSPENISVPTEWKDLAFTTVGNAWDAFAARSPAELSGQHMYAMPTAQALLRLSPVAFGQGLAVPPEEALPHYIRDKVAQTTQERAQLKLATTIST